MKIWLTGHEGMLGSAILRNIDKKKYKILTVSKKKLDLINQKKVMNWCSNNKPDLVIHCAAKVGGIYANSNFPVDFLYKNTIMQLNVVNAAFENNVRNLILLGSSCSYPPNNKRSICEDDLLSDKPEITNQWYSVAKINGIKICEAYRKQYKLNYFSIIPTNLYGPGDSFDIQSNHVIPSLIHKFHQAKLENKKSLTLWGSGKPLRDFMYVNDAAKIILLLMKKNKNNSIINIGTGNEITIKNLSKKIASVVDYKGKIIFDIKKPDGAKRKLLDIKRQKDYGFTEFTNIDIGLKKTYDYYLNEII